MTPADPLDLPPDACLVRSGDVLTTELASRELIMLDVERGTYFGIEGVSRLVWDALASPVTLAEVVERVRAAYPQVDPDACKRDVRAFVLSLLDHRLVEFDPAPRAG
jgi:hypothetical protein